MKNIRSILLYSLIGLSAGVAWAQAGSGAGPGPMGPAPGASAPRMGMGPGGARGAGRWGTDFTPGWAMMTQQERNEHRERMRSITTYDECKAAVEKHREQMAARAKERGGTMPAQPRRDACARFKP